MIDPIYIVEAYSAATGNYLVVGAYSNIGSLARRIRDLDPKNSRRLRITERNINELDRAVRQSWTAEEFPK